MRWLVRVPLLAAMLAAALWSPLRSAAEDDAPAAPQVTDEQRRRVASHATHIAKALGQSGIDGGLSGGPKAPKAGKRVVATHQIAKQPLDGAAPPPVLNDIADAPQSFWAAAAYKLLSKESKTAQIVSWLSQRPGDQEQASLNEAFEYYRTHTSAGKALDSLMRPSINDDEPTHGRANFAAMTGSYGVTIPLPPYAVRHQDERWSVTFNEALRGAPIEVRALMMGHEVGVHAADIDDDFLTNPGSQIPSELRALVMDAKNYLEIRAQLEQDEAGQARLAILHEQPGWQLSDLKARVVLGLDIAERSYSEVIQDEGIQLSRYLSNHPEAEPSQRARQYVRQRYAKSGESGMNNLDLADDSPVGGYNKATDALIAGLKTDDYPFMKHDF